MLDHDHQEPERAQLPKPPLTSGLPRKFNLKPTSLARMERDDRPLFGPTLAIALLAWLVTVGSAQDTAGSAAVDQANEVKQVLVTQAERWNAADLDGFMETYWKSENLTFSSGGKITRGWQATLNRYKTSYQPETMGTLEKRKGDILVICNTVRALLDFLDA